MSNVITIRVSGQSDSHTLTIVHTLRQALRDAGLDVRDDGSESPIAMTTLYEQQVRLAMAGTRCVVRAETIEANSSSA